MNDCGSGAHKTYARKTAEHLAWLLIRIMQKKINKKKTLNTDHFLRPVNTKATRERNIYFHVRTGKLKFNRPECIAHLETTLIKTITI